MLGFVLAALPGLLVGYSLAHGYRVAAHRWDLRPRLYTLRNRWAAVGVIEPLNDGHTAWRGRVYRHGRVGFDQRFERDRVEVEAAIDRYAASVTA